MIYLLTAIGLSPGGSSTVHIYTQTIHRTTQNKQYTEQQKDLGRVRAVPRVCELYPGICLTTEEKARKNLSQGSRRVPVGTMKTDVFIITKTICTCSIYMVCFPCICVSSLTGGRLCTSFHHAEHVEGTNN